MKTIIDFLENHLNELKLVSVLKGYGITKPDFDLNSFDYLMRAEKILISLSESNRDRILVNDFIHYLKTGMECQLDTLLNFYCIDYKKLNVPKKLRFVKELNIISSTSYTRLNFLRNKIIHDYTLVEISKNEIETYFDLTKNLIWVIQPILTIAHQNRELKFSNGKTDFFISLNEFQPLVQLQISENNKTIYKTELDFRDNKNPSEFITYAKLHLLMCQFDSFDKKETLLELIKQNNSC